VLLVCAFVKSAATGLLFSVFGLYLPVFTSGSRGNFATAIRPPRFFFPVVVAGYWVLVLYFVVAKLNIEAVLKCNICMCVRSILWLKN
jgi:hypothetical protein